MSFITKPLPAMRGNLTSKIAVTFINITLLAGAAAAQMNAQHVSFGVGGAQVDGNCNDVSMCANGRHIAFSSAATNLVAGDTNGMEDVFILDTMLGTNTRISIPSGGGEANNHSFGPSISDDATVVAFASAASNLVAGDDNNTLDVFVYDSNAGTMELVSRHTDGTLGNGASYDCKISGDGRFVVYRSLATNLIDIDTNGTIDIFMYDRQNQTTTCVSVSSLGTIANGDCIQPSISTDGTFVAFASTATNLDPSDANLVSDIFVRDTVMGTTTLVSKSFTGGATNGASVEPAISGDGNVVVWRSSATNILLNDANGVDDIFEYVFNTDTVTRVSVSSAGKPGNGTSRSPNVSTDGQYISFLSDATNMAPLDKNGATDLFVRDMYSGLTWRVNLASSAAESDTAVYRYSMAPTGTYFAHTTDASTFDVNDANSLRDVYYSWVTYGAFPIPSMNLTSLKGTFNDSAKNHGDRVNMIGTFVFNAFTPDATFDPTNDNFQISIGAEGSPHVFAIAANDGGWKSLSKGRFIWHSAKGEMPVVNFTLDVVKGKFTFNAAKVDFDPGEIGNPTIFEMWLGQEYLSYDTVWSQKSAGLNEIFKFMHSWN
ncbi:MAG: hypothetical protein HY286_01270 [Planctomycetes bacterium]|nr:hypothetical protein [Planctomycetota bacterium]